MKDVGEAIYVSQPHGLSMCCGQFYTRYSRQCQKEWHAWPQPLREKSMQSCSLGYSWVWDAHISPHTL